jgi:hypothetical protein
VATSKETVPAVNARRANDNATAAAGLGRGEDAAPDLAECDAEQARAKPRDEGIYVTFSEMRYRNRCFSFALGLKEDLLSKIRTIDLS